MVTPPQSGINFQTFNQGLQYLYPYFGNKIVVMLDEKFHLWAKDDLNTMDTIVEMYDKAYEFYQNCFDNGDKPTQNSTYLLDGRSTICVMSNGSGGLGMVGSNGVE